MASSAALHEVRFPKPIGRDGWVWEAPSDNEIPPKNLGKRPGRKPTFEMKARRRRGTIVKHYIFFKIIVAVVRSPRPGQTAAEGELFLKNRRPSAAVS